VTTRDFSRAEAAALQRAIDAVERLNRATVLAFVAQDEGGVFLVPRPGLEREVMGLLGDVEWKTMVRLAEEFGS